MKRNERLYDSERHAVLAAVYAKEGTQVDHSLVGGYRTKTVRAGDYLYVSCYPLIARETNIAQEAALTKLKLDAQGKGKLRAAFNSWNNKRRVRDFEMLANANFGRNDFHVCLTYERQDYEGRDELVYRERDDAVRDTRNWLDRVKRLMRRHGCDMNELRWIRVTVTKEWDKEAPRPWPDVHHHHWLIHGIPEHLRSEIENLWPHGYANADRLKVGHKGIADMAGYIARQEGRANGESGGKKAYSSSRNLIRPEVRTSDARISMRRAAQIAADVRMNGRAVFGEIYPDWRLTEDAKVELSDFVAGAYIYATLKLKASDWREEDNAGAHRMVSQKGHQQGAISGAQGHQPAVRRL